MGYLHPEAAVSQVTLVHQLIGRADCSPVEAAFLAAVGHLVPRHIGGEVGDHFLDVLLTGREDRRIKIAFFREIAGQTVAVHPFH